MSRITGGELQSIEGGYLTGGGSGSRLEHDRSHRKCRRGPGCWPEGGPVFLKLPAPAAPGEAAAKTITRRRVRVRSSSLVGCVTSKSAHLSGTERVTRGTARPAEKAGQPASHWIMSAPPAATGRCPSGIDGGK